MRVVAWNVQRARGARRAALVPALCTHNPDVAVLIDVPAAHGDLLEALRSAGFNWFGHAAGSDDPTRVLIASRVKAITTPHAALEPELNSRWAEVVISRRNLRIAGLYVPVTGNRAAQKRRMWQTIRAEAAARREERYLIIGDWNTGDVPLDKSHPIRPFRFTTEYRELVKGGFIEAWRYFHPTAQEYSWFRSDGRGFRIDHAFVSPGLRAQLKDCRYSHREREDRLSDHSILIVDLK
jgi:exodeoxyribonuclease III